MNKKRLNKDYTAFIILLALIAGLNLAKQAAKSNNEASFPGQGEIFVEIAGDIKFPGVYNFSKRPQLTELIRLSGGPKFNKKIEVSSSGQSYHSGEKVTFQIKGGHILILKERMDAFNKLTLGLPLSMNQETAEGLTAIPGIGPKTANSIVKERIKKNGFKNYEELMTVPGVGSNLYQRIRPFLKL
ncbi:ComEA family DNA-binding protein [Thermodesulfobacteriota bacterium]